MLCFQRPKDVSSYNGKEAIALWYKFVFGDDDALQLLIKYNFYDTVGMMFFKKIFGNEFPKICKAKKFYHQSLKNHIRYKKQILSSVRNYINRKNFDLSLLKTSETKRIVGIDLAGVIKKTSHTGICLLIGNTASTKVVQSNEDIVSFVIEAGADIVSIDAPLSLPKGRTTVYNDDPMRESAGIIRHSERVLHARDVNSYPALIDSMQELTKRGILLSKKFRKMGYPVIECFPGAAQDILQLPRKRTDESLLKTGLMRLGIRGDYINRKVVHDELDAITAAIVGKFFIDGYYEPIGIPEENDMIIPSQVKIDATFRIIIGIAGQIAAGKTTVATYLEKMGFSYCRYSQILEDMLKKESIEINRSSLQQIGGKLFDFSGQYGLNRRVEEHIFNESHIVIDGMRHFEDYTYWKEKCFKNFYLIFIHADQDICSSRYSEGDYQIDMQHHAEQEIEGLRLRADTVISNNGTIDELYAKIDNFLNIVKVNSVVDKKGGGY